ncbi:MAG TPA: hypothetical protein VFU46_14605 [Gemmatimonadales bacterium]|nr:hypothetical protein [Gemmatimonadales bacterium]
MAEQPPAQLDRAALERIMQRAAELQTADRDIGDHLTPDEVLALGREVGIPAHYLQQALLEERTRLPQQPAGGLLDRIAGPGTVATRRVVRGDVDSAERALLRFMEQHELLRVQRQQPGRISWEPVGGLPAAIRRSAAALGGGQRPFMLTRARIVTATFTPLEPEYCQVTLAADVTAARGGYVGSAAGVATLGAGAAALLFALGAAAAMAVAPLPLGLAAGYATLRRFQPVPARVLLGLERALDHLERGAARPAHQPPRPATGLLDAIADEVRRSLR